MRVRGGGGGLTKFHNSPEMVVRWYGTGTVQGHRPGGVKQWRIEGGDGKSCERSPPPQIDPNWSSRSWAPDLTLVHDHPSPFAPICWDDDPVPFLFHIEASAKAIASGAPARLRRLNPPKPFLLEISSSQSSRFGMQLVAPPLSRVCYFLFSAKWFCLSHRRTGLLTPAFFYSQDTHLIVRVIHSDWTPSRDRFRRL